MGTNLLDSNNAIVPEDRAGDYAIHDYLIMEYNNLQAGAKRRQYLFDPQK